MPHRRHAGSVEEPVTRENILILHVYSALYGYVRFSVLSHPENGGFPRLAWRFPVPVSRFRKKYFISIPFLYRRLQKIFVEK